MKLRHSILGLLLCGSLVVSNLQAAPAQPKQELAAGSALLIDLKTGQELYSSNPDLRLPVASVTKLMTAMVVLDAKLPLDERLPITIRDTQETINRLTRYIDDLMYESRVRKELTAETALAIMGGQLQADTQAMRVPDGRRPDPAPLDNGRVKP